MQHEHPGLGVHPRNHHGFARRERRLHQRPRVPFAAERERQQHRARRCERRLRENALDDFRAGRRAGLRRERIARREQLPPQRELRLAQRGAVRRPGGDRIR